MKRYYRPRGFVPTSASDEMIFFVMMENNRITERKPIATHKPVKITRGNLSLVVNR